MKRDDPLSGGGSTLFILGGALIFAVIKGHEADIPQEAIIGVVFVTTARPSTSIRGMAYTPLANSPVRFGSEAACFGNCLRWREGAPGGSGRDLDALGVRRGHGWRFFTADGRRQEVLEPGRQTRRVHGAWVFVLPSTSARNAAYSRDVILGYFRDLCALPGLSPTATPRWPSCSTASIRRIGVTVTRPKPPKPCSNMPSGSSASTRSPACSRHAHESGHRLRRPPFRPRRGPRRRRSPASRRCSSQCGVSCSPSF